MRLSVTLSLLAALYILIADPKINPSEKIDWSGRSAKISISSASCSRSDLSQGATCLSSEICTIYIALEELITTYSRPIPPHHALLPPENVGANCTVDRRKQTSEYETLNAPLRYFSGPWRFDTSNPIGGYAIVTHPDVTPTGRDVAYADDPLTLLIGEKEGEECSSNVSSSTTRASRRDRCPNIPEPEKSETVRTDHFTAPKPSVCRSPSGNREGTCCFVLLSEIERQHNRLLHAISHSDPQHTAASIDLLNHQANPANIMSYQNEHQQFPTGQHHPHAEQHYQNDGHPHANHYYPQHAPHHLRDEQHHQNDEQSHPHPEHGRHDNTRMDLDDPARDSSLPPLAMSPSSRTPFLPRIKLSRPLPKSSGGLCV